MTPTRVKFQEPLKRPPCHLLATVKLPYEHVAKSLRYPVQEKDFLQLHKLTRLSGLKFEELTFSVEHARGRNVWTIAEEAL